MKRITSYLLPLFASALLFIGCSEEDEANRNYYQPTLKPHYLQVYCNGGIELSNSATSTTFQVESYETPWQLTNNASWLSFPVTSGTDNAYFSATVSENTYAYKRAAIVTFSSADPAYYYEQNFTLTQKGSKAYITPATLNVSATGAAGTYRVNVDANCAWRISNVTSSWVTATATTDNQLQLTIEANPLSTTRYCTITLRNDSANIQSGVSIAQQPAGITASTDPLVFDNTASTQTVEVNAEAAWTAATSNSWIELSPTTGAAGKSTLSVSVAPNSSTSERTGDVCLSIGSNQLVNIPVHQRGIYIDVDKDNLEFEAKGGSISVEVESNTEWFVILPNWLKCSQQIGRGNANITFTADENASSSSRAEKVTILDTKTDAYIATNINVSQKGYTFSLDTPQLQYGAAGGNNSIHFTSNGTCKLSTNDTWLHIGEITTADASKGSYYVVVKADENNADDERIGHITMSMGNETTDIVVIQEGQYFTIDNDALDFTSHGGKLDLTLATSGSWTATVNAEAASWLTLSHYEDDDDNKSSVTIIATDNPTTTPRTGTVTFTTQTGRNVRLMVTQAARYLRLSTARLNFYAKGGTSNAVTVETDGTFTASTTDSWLTVQRTGNTFTVVALANNSADVRTGTVTVRLTDLTDGELTRTISVTQLNKGGSFTKTDFDDDKQYDTNGNSQQPSLTIGGYKEDKQYD